MRHHANGACALPGIETADLGTLVLTDADRALTIAATIHGDLYRESFPIEDEREPLSAWEDVLLGRVEDGPRMTFTVLGTGLCGPRPDPFAFMIGELYPASNCALLTYSARKRTGPGNLGGQLLARTLDGLRRSAPKGLRGVFAECNDPAKVAWGPGEKDARDVMDPARRIALFSAPPYNMRRINIDYHQPPLQKGGSGCADLILFGLPGANCPVALRDFLDEVRSFLTRDFTPDRKDTEAMARALAQVDEMIAGARPMHVSARGSPERGPSTLDPEAPGGVLTR